MAREKKRVVKLTYLVAGVILLYFCLSIGAEFFSSIYFDRPERISVVFYSKRPFLLSFGLADNVDYVVSFDNDHKVLVPGGYGRYAIGSIGKLSQLEKRPELISQAFSSITSSFVDWYFLPNNVAVYDLLDEDSQDFSKKLFIKTIFDRQTKTNAKFFDKLYLSYLIFNHRRQDFIVVSASSIKTENNEKIFSETSFSRKVNGFFFQKSLREESAEVKLYYTSYSAAQNLSRVMQGSGIRVVDLENSTLAGGEECTLVYDQNSTAYKKTARYLKKRLNCNLKPGTVKGATLAIYLNREIETIWQ